MIKKLLLHSLLFGSILFFAFITTASTTASDQSMMIMPRDPDGGLNPAGIFGQDQYYTVTFRGNGEAVVNLKTIFTNTEEATMSAITLRVPKVQPEDLTAYQVVREKYCQEYEPRVYDSETRTYKPVSPQCIRYQDPNYYDYYYSNSLYKKADVSVDGDTITVSLPEGISPNSSGSFVLFYRSVGYTSKSMFGSYDYSFETFKVSDPIRNLQVGIMTDSDMVLKNATTDVNYRFDETVAKMSTDQTVSSSGMANQAFDTYYQQIGQGSIVETASSLQPLDSFTVEGSYADSVWQLYSNRIIIGVVIFIVLVAIVFYILYRLIRHFKNKQTSPRLDAPKNSRVSNVLWVSGSSLGASLLAGGYTAFLFIVTSYINSYFYSSQYSMLIGLFILILSIGFYPLVLFVPSVIIGIKKGLWWGVATFSMTIMWLMFYLFLVVIFVMFTGMSRGYPEPVFYNIRGASDTAATEELQVE